MHRSVFLKLTLKQEVFGRLAVVVGPDTLQANNTGAIPLSTLAVAVFNPQGLLGLQLFSPVPMMQAVEAVRSRFTGAEVCGCLPFSNRVLLSGTIPEEPVGRCLVPPAKICRWLVSLVYEMKRHNARIGL